MKRVLMISAFILIYKSASTQTLQTVTNNGAATTATISVGGINTGTLNVARPAALVDYGNSISGDLLFTPLNFGAATNGYLKLSYPDNTTARFSMEYDGHIGAGVFRNIQFGKAQTPYLTIRDGGGVGIGTTSPSDLLELDAGDARKGLTIKSQGDGSVYSDVRFAIKNASGIAAGKPFEWVISHRKDGYFSNSDTNGSSLEFYANNVNGGYFAPLSFKSNGDVVLVSDKNAIVGNVGIGTTSPREKLSVNGNIRSKEIKVETENWPDYVFSDQYELPTLHETENYIKQNRHLPGIPTAAEVSANGVSLGDLNAKLLKKIEELTLHMIMLEKNNEKQQKEIDSLKLKH